MATSTIKLQTNIKTGALNPASNVTIASSRVVQTGRVISIDFYASIPIASTVGWVTIGSTSGVTTPVSTSRYVFTDNSHDISINGRIDSNGKIEVYVATPNLNTTAVSGALSYIS